ncbi:MAG: response regulator [Nitrospiraceae bacterium]
MSAKILVVDDEPHLQRVVSLYLRGRNYQVATAPGGTEAIQMVADDRPDLIVADISMPGMDGFELCGRLRRNPATRTIPFIFLTAKDQDADKIRARKVGADDYLTKPCPLEQLAERVETVMDRIEQAKKIPLDRIGLSGQLEEVDVLDLVQMLELDQKTGALVLSHGERTGTLYFRDGLIVEADIRSPKREEPLYVLLGWKAGRYLFLPDAVPERMPITASLAHVLFEDLRRLEEHEQKIAVETPSIPRAADAGPMERIVTRLEEVTRRFRVGQIPTADPLIVRVLVVGVMGSGKSELIHHLVRDLSLSRWAATGNEGARTDPHTNFGLVRLSAETLLHLISVRAEKRFRSVWEHCLPEAIGIILLINPEREADMNHIHTFLKAQQALASALPIHALLPTQTGTAAVPDLDPSQISSGSVDDQTIRLTLLDSVLQQWLAKADSIFQK